MGSYAGLDWASQEHRLCVVDEQGRRLEQRPVAHSEEALQGLCELLPRLGVERVAITVVPVDPNMPAGSRSRYSVAGGKSDGFDAYVLAELARTDMHRLRPIEPDADETKALRALTRARQDLVETRVALCNRLRCELEAFWPGAARVFGELDSPICLAFLERYPSPQDARGLGAKRMAGFLARNGYCGRKSAAELVSSLRAAPEGSTGELEAEAPRAVVLALVACLRPLVEQIKLLTSQIGAAVRAHPDGKIFLSLFLDPNSVVTAAELLAEIGDSRARYPSDAALAADSGQSPVAVESGKRKLACFRYACDKRLRDAVSVLADSSRQHNPWAKAIHDRAIARGKDHPHAIRIPGRARLRVIWRIWQDRTPYNPAKHGNLQHLLTHEG